MPQRTCENCGNTFATLSAVWAGQEGFCNVGCAIRARVPVDAEGNFPVNKHLVAVLALIFLFLNQAMIGGVSALLVQRGRGETSLKLAWVSFALALLIWSATLIVQRLEKVARGKDFVVAGVTLGILLAAIWKTEPRVGLGIAGTTVLLIWNLRGLAMKQRLTQAESAKK